MSPELKEKYEYALGRVTEYASWYESIDGEPQNVHGSDAPCPICWKPLALPREQQKRTSLMYPGGRRSMFYAMHPECSARGDCPEREAADAAALDLSEMQ